MRVRRGNRRAKKRKKILKQAKGYYGAKSKAHRIAKEAVEKSLTYSYRDRRTRKRDFRRLWIVRINAAARQNGLSYNRLINGLKRAGCAVDRKVLAELAVEDPSGFAALAAAAKEALGDSAPSAKGADAAPVEDESDRAAAEALVAQALGSTEAVEAAGAADDEEE